MFVDDVVSLLVQAGVGKSGTTIFWSSHATYPAGDGPFLSVFETPGQPPWTMQYSDTVPAYTRPSAQIVARGGRLDATRVMIQNAYNALVQKRNLTINGVWYLKIDVSQEPFDLGPDENGRIRFAFNINAVKRPS